MAKMSTVTIKDNTTKILSEEQQAKSVFLRMAAEEVVRIARPITPKLAGNLSRDVLIVSAGSSSINIIWNKAYAQYQERGMRKDGSHVVKKYTTGGTGKGFAEYAVNKVTSKTGDFILKATRLM